MSVRKADMEISNKSGIPLNGNENACRVCLFPHEDNKCLFTFTMTCNHHDSADLWEKLQFYGGIQVKPGDGMPSKICDKCILNLRYVHDFRMQCQETDRKLRSLIENDSNENNTNSSRGVKNKEFECSDDYYAFNNECGENFTALVKSPSNVSQDDTKFSKESVDPKKITENKTLGKRGERNKWNEENFHKTWKKHSELSRVFLNDERSKINAQNSTTEESFTSNSAAGRSKRLIVFRRMTSMENLKNRKERQRRHVKKTMCIKNNRENHEISETNEIRRVSSRQSRSNLTISSHRSTKCRRSYETKRLLNEHEFSHDTDEFFRDRCDETFSKLVEYSEHSKSHESKENPNSAICKICKKHFRKVSTMVRHLHVHKRENPRAVYAILKKIRDERKTEKSRDINWPLNILNYPDENHSRFEEINEKIITRVPKDLTSKVCTKNEDSFDISRTNGNSDETEIPSDDRSAIKLINIWIREELNSENEGRGFACDICKKSYATKKSLLKHTTKIHHEPCDICQENCNCRDKIEKTDKNNDATKFHRCNECEKSFENETKLKKHTRIHKSDEESNDKNFKRFLCHICSKTFRQNTGLMFHMRTHTGYKPHVCKHCGRGFTSNSNCINHERTHTGDRPFVCHFCSAAFAKSCTLKAHITTHTGEANYHCKTCGKSFRRLKYLKEHRFTHTGEKPYVCKTCGTAYGHSGSLFVHEKKCKALRDNCQLSTNNYDDDRTMLINNSDLEIDDPISLSQTFDDSSINPNENKIFIDDLQIIDRINIHSDDIHSHDVHSSQKNVISNVRNFNSNGQVFPV